MPPNEYRPGLKPPQFSLRTLLLIVTLSAIFCAVSNFLPPLMTAGLIFLAICVAAHIAGNALGTRLRENGNRAIDAVGQPLALPQHSSRSAPNAPPTALCQRRSLGWPVLAATLCGILACGTGGGLWTALNGAAPAISAIIIAVVSFGVLGGFSAFLAFSFVQVGLGALGQAMSNPRAAKKP